MKPLQGQAPLLSKLLNFFTAFDTRIFTELSKDTIASLILQSVFLAGEHPDNITHGYTGHVMRCIAINNTLVIRNRVLFRKVFSLTLFSRNGLFYEIYLFFTSESKSLREIGIYHYATRSYHEFRLKPLLPENYTPNTLVAIPTHSGFRQPEFHTRLALPVLDKQNSVAENLPTFSHTQQQDRWKEAISVFFRKLTGSGYKI